MVLLVCEWRRINLVVAWITLDQIQSDGVLKSGTTQKISGFSRTGLLFRAVEPVNPVSVAP